MKNSGESVRHVTRELATFASALNYEKLPATTVDMARRLLLDGIGCLLVGGLGELGNNATSMVRRVGGLPQATLMTDLKAASVRDAAFVNGICLYSVGLNDVHKPAGVHPGGCIVPAILAVGEWQHSSGANLLAAMTAGYEVAGRIGRAIRPSHRQRGFHPTGTCGTFGAAAASARLLDVDPEGMASVLGIAGSQAAGLYECHHDGTSTMIFHAGRAAQNGVEAALLAQAGFTGPATILEGSKGFFQATSNQFDIDAAMANFGTDFEIEATSFRPYFGCNSTLAASGSMAQLLLSNKALLAEVESITAYCHPVVAQDNADKDPHTLLAGRLSLPFNMALVLVLGDVMSTDLDEKTLNNPRIRSLLPKITVMADQNIPRYGCLVRVRKIGGAEIESRIDEPRGSDAHPLLWTDVVEKFYRLVAPLGNSGACKAVVSAVENLETIDASELMRVLRSVRIEN